MKNLLVIYYSQTGQLKEIISNFISPLFEKYAIDIVEIKADQYKFPLTWAGFFDVFPETVLHKPCKIRYSIPEKEYDLILLGIQPWFLHPSVPIQSFLMEQKETNLFANKPVYLITDSRNTWRNSLYEVEQSILNMKGLIKGKFVFRDTSKNIKGLKSLLQWLFTGKKTRDKEGNIISGVSQEIISNAAKHSFYLLNEETDQESPYIILPHVPSEYTSIGYEKYAIEKYEKWSKLFLNNKFRKFKLFLFQVWILTTILFIIPFVAKKNRNK